MLVCVARRLVIIGSTARAAGIRGRYSTACSDIEFFIADYAARHRMSEGLSKRCCNFFHQIPVSLLLIHRAVAARQM